MSYASYVGWRTDKSYESATLLDLMRNGLSQHMFSDVNCIDQRIGDDILHAVSLTPPLIVPEYVDVDIFIVYQHANPSYSKFMIIYYYIYIHIYFIHSNTYIY